ncbi:hypothetical protein FFH90_024775 [Pseudomonas sp. ATCC 43928]|nr:hypothetical protein FFH90_024775 [Pseudomonas sp. ATCC 43928]
MLLVGNPLVFELCRRIDTPFKEEGNGHRRMRFIRTMKRNTWNREKMWAGQTAPFFCLQKSKKARKGPFREREGNQRSRCSILPGLPSHSAESGNGSFRSVMFGHTSANSMFS